MNQTAIQFKPIQKNSNLCYFLYVEKALDAFSISMLVKSSLLWEWHITWNSSWS